MKPVRNARTTKVIAPPRPISLARTAASGPDDAASGQAKIPIKTTPVATAAAILNLISKDNSII
jgi:hypothetical protein